MIGIIILVLVAAIVTWLWLLIRYGGAKCPRCGGKMKMIEYTDTINIWICRSCGHKITVEDCEE